MNDDTEGTSAKQAEDWGDMVIARQWRAHEEAADKIATSIRAIR